MQRVGLRCVSCIPSGGTRLKVQHPAGRAAPMIAGSHWEPDQLWWARMQGSSVALRTAERAVMCGGAEACSAGFLGFFFGVRRKR